MAAASLLALVEFWLHRLSELPGFFGVEAGSGPPPRKPAKHALLLAILLEPKWLRMMIFFCDLR